jgi:ribosomal protein S18 acetylase RimI-like enzyme
VLSNYGAYILEREGKRIIEDEHGFVTYKLMTDFIYLEDLYVKSEYRRAKHAYTYIDKVFEAAKDLKYNKVITSVSTAAAGVTRNVSGLIKYGFEIDSCDGQMIWFKKEVL